MQLISILRRVERHQGFVYEKARWRQGTARLALEVLVRPRKGSRPICSGCGQRRTSYDRLPARRCEFVPLWGIAVWFVYRMRRVDCPTCGVCVERVPWAHGQCRQTKTYRWFLARWARRLSWQEVAEVFHTSWNSVYRAVRYAVIWGLAHREIQDVEAIGIDEIAWRRGHKYLTLIYQIDEGCRRLLSVVEERTEAGLRLALRSLGRNCLAGLRFVCSDLWRPYLNAIAAQTSPAVHVLDRFHVMSHFSKAIDQVRADEARRLKRDGFEPVLKHSRWCLLKRSENLSDRQTVKLRELLQYNLRSVRAYLLKEDFQRFWEYRSAHWAGRFLDEWCTRTMRSRLEPMQRIARMLRAHRTLLENWFRAQGTISTGVVEGFNNKAKLATKKAYGFRTYHALETALYHQLAKLPEPHFTHEFC